MEKPMTDREALDQMAIDAAERRLDEAIRLRREQVAEEDTLAERQWVRRSEDLMNS